MYGSSNFWILIDWLKSNDDCWGQVEIDERKALQHHIQKASQANVLTGIPSDSMKFVKALVAVVQQRLKEQQEYFRRNKGCFVLGR